MKLKDYNRRIVDGPINESRTDEEFEGIREDIKYIDYVIYNGRESKVKKAGIIEALKIAKSKYSFLYEVKSIEYPDDFKEKKKLDIKVGDIFTELKFYTFFDKKQSAIKEFDKQVDNELRFNKLSKEQLALIWYDELSDTEKEYIKLL